MVAGVLRSVERDESSYLFPVMLTLNCFENLNQDSIRKRVDLILSDAASLFLDVF